uniref:NAD kinase 2, mitochondrial n=1 Tax=Angiostrongylus cantonensis TaxID=6313 RepID=A0A158PB22_ANGCA
LSKITRYEFEKRLHQDLDEEQLEIVLRRRGSDYHQLIRKHEVHHSYLQTIQSELDDAGVESKVVQRFDYTEDAINWADAVMTAGGDGTFLLAASRIHQRDKPVIGINTDPQGSEGYMCLMRKQSKEHFRPALHRLLNGDFHWLYRQRIRITLSGESYAGVGDSIELHDQQLNTIPATTRWMDSFSQPSTSGTSLDRSAVLNKTKKTMKRVRSPPRRVTMQLPVLALNEVFIGESLSSRVSYYEIQIDNGKMTKQKSSGIAICTGTGSTSWCFNINKLTEQCVSDLLRITSEHCGVQLPADDKQMVTDICTKFNQQLIFEPDSLLRDPIFNSTFSPTTPRGFAEKIRVKSRGYDAHLVVDGAVSYRFNDGAEAFVEVHEEDALQTVVFR